MLIATDLLSLIFIACFLFGLIFLIGSALLGNLGHGGGSGHAVSHHIGVHIGEHAASPTHAGTPHTVGHTSGTHTAVTHGHASAHGATTQGQQHAGGNNLAFLSYVNPTSIVLFLLGFGFFGYVFHNTAHLLFPLTLVLAGVGGLVIAGLLLVMLSRLFGNSEGATVQDVSDRTGLLGKVSITIQENNLGEIIYTSPGGMRKSIPARSVDGQRLERGQEVVVVNYQQGVAEVDTWERFINENEEEETQAETPKNDEMAKLRALLEESKLEESNAADTELVMRKELQKE
jgi:hypothetical protein